MALIVGLMLAAARRRRARAAARTPGELSVPDLRWPARADTSATGAAPTADALQAADAPAEAEAVVEAPARPTPAPAPLAASYPDLRERTPAPAQRSSDQIRAEIAAHAERLASARAARAQRNSAEAAARLAAERPSAAAAMDLSLDDLRADDGPVFDPTRSTPWQRVAESVARARAGEASTKGATEALRAAVASGGDTTTVPRPASVRPSDFMVRTAVPRMPPIDPAELRARPRRILIADDARVVRVKLQRLLQAQGWQVTEAADGDAALQALEAERPDLVITDVDMPGCNGFMLTRALRARPATADVPVVMITAADDQHRDEAMRAGVTVLLGKPYGEAALLSHLCRLMGLPPVPPVATTRPAELATA
ncbi:response regulator [Aquabacterium sp. OR-4]|uniref:response regulator n=1 Tax=Aquabacterium sp. OR-4 TaxID=2978127 RepID=UPI0021B389AD|nr:response regulator [Aquabacterium sp. OR-4]MDT7838502.1 response regulator [Aquabacterium sp. OR-4]